MAREDKTTTWREENTIYIEGPWVTNISSTLTSLQAKSKIQYQMLII